MVDYSALRERMISEQLVSRSISDERVLGAFKKVERHRFVPEKFQDSAYADCPLAVGEGQTISQPYMAALMTEALELKGSERVLEIGTGSGYQAAILAETAKEVYTIERFESLAKRAQRILEGLGYGNIAIKIADGTLGWEEEGPFDRIIITAGAPELPQRLLSQLKTGGKMVLPLGTRFSQVLTVIEKAGDKITARDLCGCVFVPLVGKDGWKAE